MSQNFEQNKADALKRAVHRLEAPVSTDKLGRYLLNKGIITEEQCNIALSEQIVTKQKLGEVLIRLGFVDREDIVSALAKINPSSLIGEEQIHKEIPVSFLLEHKTYIILNTEKSLLFATLHHDPDFVKKQLDSIYNTNVVQSMKKKIERLKFPVNEIKKKLKKMKSSKAGYLIDSEEHDVNKILEALINGAILENASDIHIEQAEHSVQVRFRIDGVLHMKQILKTDLANRLFSRIKDKAGMDVSERRRTQDGSFSQIYQDRTVDFRVGVMPGKTGEKITIRILDREKAIMDLHDLGLTKIDEWKKLSTWSNGLILVCGATGSGKTTTLYSTVKTSVDKLHKAVYSIEDPVEYQMPFITQVQVNRGIGLNFSTFLRSVLRHDPDIVILGEIRDKETAEHALQLAETGHLVYATLHTNDVASSISRLIELDVPKEMLADLLRGILTQKLARKICIHCQGKGCAVCLQTGYKGRTLVSEFCSFQSRQEVYDVNNRVKSYYNFILDSSVKLLRGITNLNEVERIFGIDVQEKVIAYLIDNHREEIQNKLLSDKKEYWSFIFGNDICERVISKDINRVG